VLGFAPDAQIGGRRLPPLEPASEHLVQVRGGSVGNSQHDQSHTTRTGVSMLKKLLGSLMLVAFVVASSAAYAQEPEKKEETKKEEMSKEKKKKKAKKAKKEIKEEKKEENKDEKKPS
jgi:hypothetical protein